MGRRGAVFVDAVVSDLMMDLGGEPLGLKDSRPFRREGANNRNYLRQVLVCCWLFHDNWFLDAKRFSQPVLKWLTKGLKPLARLVSADLFVSDPDRREELVRLCLEALELRPSGETEAQAADRLRTLDSVERERIIQDTKAQLEHARQLRKAMQEQKAREAAARHSRE